MKNHYIICGFGRIGKVISKLLHEDGKPFVVIDNNPDELNRLAELGYLCLEGAVAHGRASSILAFGTINNKAVSRLYKAICGFLAFRGSWLRLSLLSIELHCFSKICDQNCDQKIKEDTLLFTRMRGRELWQQ